MLLRMRELTHLQKSLAEEFVATRNAGLAYRRVYNPPSHLSSSELWGRAKQALGVPAVKAYVVELNQQVLANLMISAQDIIQDWVDIVNADPNELIAHVRVNCRFCRGLDHRFQWVEQDYYMAVAAAIEASKPMPDGSGGHGFNGTLEPVETCPSCFGLGVGEVRVADTTKLSPSARKLFKGIKVSKNGTEVLMHDQQEARNLIAQCMGLLDGAGSLLLKPPEKDATANSAVPLTQEEASREYLRLVGRS